MNDLQNRITKNALVIVNPKAGRIRVRSQVLDLTKLSINGVSPTMYATAARGDATKLAESFAENYDMVICRGGDGTFSEVVNGLMRIQRKIPLGYIPSGTTNDLAKALKIPNNTRKANEIILGGNALPHDVGLFCGERYFSYISSFGAFTKVSYETPQEKKNSLGFAAYLLEAPRCITDIKPVHARVLIDGEELEGDYVYGSVSNSTSVGGVLRFDMNTVDMADGKFEVMLVENPKTFARWKDAVLAVKTLNYDMSGCIFFRQCRRVEFFFEKEIPWTLDGEFVMGRKHTVIENIEKAIDVYR